MKYFEERAYIGNLDQLFGVRRYTLNGGKQEGVKCIEVDNGSGLNLTIVADRAMDIYQIKFNGQNLNYITPQGITHPAYYDAIDANWLQSFFAGFLTTCGLYNIGTNCESDGVHGIHGRLANIPAEECHTEVVIENGVPTLCISGTMKESIAFGVNLTLKRTIKCTYQSNEIEIVDTVENTGHKVQPYMILYHCNFGYPLLCEDSEIHIPTNQITARTPHAQNNINSWKEITPPADAYEEMCYYHDIKSDENGYAQVGVTNKRLGIGAFIEFDKSTLDHFVQWKMYGKGEYVLGLEPCNSMIEGQKHAKENGILKYLQPGEKSVNKIKLEFQNI